MGELASDSLMEDALEGVGDIGDKSFLGLLGKLWLCELCSQL